MHELLLQPAALADVAGVQDEAAHVRLVDERGDRRLGLAPAAVAVPERELEGAHAVRLVDGGEQRRLELAAVGRDASGR